MKIDLENIIFEITQECNLNCKYCYNIWKGDERLKSNLKPTYKSSIKAIKQLLKTTTIKSITFTGGEPLLAERFMEIVLYCRLKGLSVSVISNGNTYQKEEYKQLIDMGVSLFEFPLLSNDEKIHDGLTRVIGSWQKVVNSIREVLQLGGIVAGVIVITRENYADIDKTLELHKALGIDSVMLNRYNIGGEGVKTNKTIAPTKQQLEEAFSRANLFAGKSNIFLSSNVCTPWCIINPQQYPNIEFFECSNLILDKPITVDYEGNMRICNHSPNIIGNIFKSPMSELVDNDYIRSWDNTVPDYCTECKVFDKCKGGCRGASEQMGWSLKEVDPIIKTTN